MGCGLSLPIDYLANDPRTDEDFMYQDHFKDAPAFLKVLKTAGVASIELRAIKATTDSKNAAVAAKHILDTELDITIHGYLPSNSDGDRFEKILPSIASIADILKQRNRSAVMTLHCYRAQNGDLSQLVDYNVNFIKRLTRMILDEKLPLKIALEINRQKKYTDPSITYDSLINLSSEIAESELVGFCWDFGHSCWNASKNYIDLTPPDEFLAKVIHTHIHDLSPGGETHWPLSESVVPLTDFVFSLKEKNYAGAYNLELRPERWQNVIDPKTGIFESISILKDNL